MRAGSSSKAARPSLICLHGFAQRGDSWAAVADRFGRRGWDVDAPDLPALIDGRGEAADPLDAVCAGVASLVRDLFRKTRSKPILVGYSMGGRIALETVLRADAASLQEGAEHALPIAGLVLESAGLGPADDAERDGLRRRNEEWAARVCSEGVEAFMDWWEALPLFASQRLLSDETRASLREGRLRNDPATLALELSGWGQHRQSARSTALACLNGLAARGVASAFFAGALDRKYCAVAEEVRAAAPATTVRIFPGAGHNIHLEDPEGYVRALAEWCENPLLQATPTCG